MGWDRFARTCRHFAFVTIAICAGSVRADEETLPSIRTLSCVTACAEFSPPQRLTQNLPLYPFMDTEGAYVEGYVRLQYRIDPDGHVSDIALLQLIGPQTFADSTIRTVKDWTYTPATLGGKPVSITHTLLMTFANPHFSPGAREHIIHLYRIAWDLIHDHKWDEAYAKLSEAQSTTKLNFYERGMLANVAAMVAMQRGDFAEAARLTELATNFGTNELPAEVVRRLWETRIRAALSVNDLVDAQESFDKLKAVKDFDAASPIAGMIEEARTRLDALPVYSVDARIPKAVDGAGIYMNLHRRNFAFRTISGSLDRFTLSCRQRAIESKITETAEWHVPENWSGCSILVRGTPGTTFKIFQATT